MPTFSFRNTSGSAPGTAMGTNSPPSKKTISEHPPQLGPEHARPLRKTSNQHLQAPSGGVQTTSKALPSVPSDQTTTRTLRPSASASSFRHPSPSAATPISPPPSSSGYSQRSASPSNSNSSSHPDTDTANTSATTITTVTSDDDASAAPVVPPLTRVHFFCYHFHRTFAPSRNTHNPVPCMTCLKANDDKDSRRWRCTFCCLRICTECVRGIGKCKDRSLMVFMEELVTALEQEGKQMQAERESGGSDEDEGGGGGTCSSK